MGFLGTFHFTFHPPPFFPWFFFVLFFALRKYCVSETRFSSSRHFPCFFFRLSWDVSEVPRLPLEGKKSLRNHQKRSKQVYFALIRRNTIFHSTVFLFFNAFFVPKVCSGNVGSTFGSLSFPGQEFSPPQIFRRFPRLFLSFSIGRSAAFFSTALPQTGSSFTTGYYGLVCLEVLMAAKPNGRTIATP